MDATLYEASFQHPDNSNMLDAPMEEKLQYILNEFRIPGRLVKYHWIPSGHINTTYYVACDAAGEFKEYLVQMVNWYVFQQPVSMMHNIDLITEHIRRKQEADGALAETDAYEHRRTRLHFHHTAEGNNYLMIGSGERMEFWRLTNFIEDSLSFETAGDDERVLRMSGKAFGLFEARLNDFDATLLTESIPHFHDTRWRMNTLFHDAAEDPVGRVALVKDELDEIERNRSFSCRLNEMQENGEIPIRVTHNDTKTNNVLFDRVTLEPLVVIDLDTVMPGLAAFDFGDTIRFAACTAEEDERDTEKMKLNLKLFRAFTEGYVGETANFLTEGEVNSMALGAAIVTLELAGRFLDDYINGDKYFRIDYPEHNLVRARAQLALFRDMMLHFDEMDAIVHEVAGR